MQFPSKRVNVKTNPKRERVNYEPANDTGGNCVSNTKLTRVKTWQENSVGIPYGKPNLPVINLPAKTECLSMRVNPAKCRLRLWGTIFVADVARLQTHLLLAGRILANPATGGSASETLTLRSRAYGSENRATLSLSFPS